MWTANAATVSPAPDTADGRCHLTPANLVTMPHRAQEWPDTARQLALAFADAAHFALHDPVPPSFGDEGAANHMRLCDEPRRAGRRGVRLWHAAAAPFPPASTNRPAARSRACTGSIRRGRCSSSRTPPRSPAGAFHNDVVAVSQRARAVHPRRGVRRPAGRLCSDPRRVSRARGGRGARQRGAASPRRSAPTCSTRSSSRCPAEKWR